MASVISATVALAPPGRGLLKIFFPLRTVARLRQIKPVKLLLVKLLAILAAPP
jgi:hypothetical protein